MHHGNFQIEDRLDERIALRNCEILASDASGALLRFSGDGRSRLEARCAIEEGRLVIGFSSPDTGANRWWFALPAEDREHVYGCGEQFSFLDLRGKKFPLWTSEQGVGRNKSTPVTRMADAADQAGGDYWWTFFPQPSFVSSRRLWYHLDTSAYAVFDFTDARRHELSSWALPRRLVIGSASTMRDLLVDQSAHFGRQPELPGWVYGGVILGIQGGTDACLEKVERARAAGVPVCGIWAQDWQGINVTSFGQRLRWNWEWDRERYPGLDGVIGKLEAEGVRFLGYLNPYVATGRSLFVEAAASEYLAKDGKGADYLVDFGEFTAGIVDFTNPAAFAWYKGVIRRNLVGLGLAGWMADFGEYLPTDAVLASGESAEIAHNAWPALWARCNREAVDESGRADILWFMRAGGPGSQRSCPMMWAGDQNVDWSEDDGLPSVITAALSLGLSGHGLSHSDMGGYTTLFGMRRTKELLLRWVELAALSPLMRGHEGNRPGDNWQFDSDADTLAGLARMGRFHVALEPYLRAVVAENAATGIPVMRPLFLDNEGDEAAWSIKDQYFLGPDLLVAPVVTEGATGRRLHLTPGAWVHLWSGTRHEAPAPSGRNIELEAPLGQPPVLYREGSEWADVFRAAAAGTLHPVPAPP
jgi:alpha-glucosidase